MTCRSAHPFRAAPSGRSFPNRFRLVPGAHARRTVRPLLPGPFPACVRRSRAPRRLAAPSRTVSGLCPVLTRAAPSGRSFPNRFRLVPGAHAAPSGRSFPNRFRLVPGAQARRAVRPLLPGPFPACVRRSGPPHRQAARRTSAPFPEAHAAHARPSPGAHAARETRIGRQAWISRFPAPKVPLSSRLPRARRFLGRRTFTCHGVRGQQTGSPGAGNVSCRLPSRSTLSPQPMHPQSCLMFFSFPAAPGRASSRPRTGALSSGVPARLAPHTRNRTSEISGDAVTISRFLRSGVLSSAASPSA